MQSTHEQKAERVNRELASKSLWGCNASARRYNFYRHHQLACAALVPPEKVAAGTVFHFGDRRLKPDVCSGDIIRVAYVNDTVFFARMALRQACRMPAHNSR